MSTREQVIVTGPVDDMVTSLIDVVRRSRPTSLELAYDRVGKPLVGDDEPGPDDTVRWTATVTWPNRLTVVGEHIVEPGRHQSTGPIYALAHLIEQLGGNVVLVDMTDGSDPR